jgi:1-acyl-sn-glycerol-3-phosphate acyltransferase
MTSIETHSESPRPDVLRDIILDEFIQALGIPPGRFTRAVIRPLFGRPAGRFASLGVLFDRYVATGSFPEAARWALDSHRVELRVRASASIPPTGPLLVTSNHPGGVDCLAIAAGLGRTDLKIVASGLPFLRNLPEVARHLILVSRVGTHQRMGALRESIRHLREGGALLLFPRGKVEPDPEFFAEAEGSIEDWSPSVKLLVDAVPELGWMMAMVSGVVSGKALQHPLSKRPKGLAERQTMAEMYQIGRQIMSPRWIRQTISLSLVPVRVGPRLPPGSSPVDQMAEVVASARRTLREHWAWIRSGPTANKPA